MSDIEFYFYKEDILALKEYTLLDNEINAEILGHKDGECYLSDITECNSIRECKCCSLLRDETVILHTHANIYKSYPSLNDIHQLVNSDTIKNSIIITQWGVWQIIKNGDTISNIVDDKNKAEFVQACLDRLNENTSRDWKDTHTEFITKYIGKINDQLLKKYGCKIYFTHWNNITEDKFIVK